MVDARQQESSLWITALEACGEMAACTGSLEIAKASLIERLCSGLIVCKADYIAQYADLPEDESDDEWSTVADSHPGQRDATFRHWGDDALVDVRPGFFWEGAGWSLDEAKTDWATGSFEAVKPTQFRKANAKNRSGDFRTRRVVNGLRCEKSDIEKTIAALRDAKKKRKPGSGRTERKGAWEAFWHAIVQLSQEDKLTRSNFPKIQDFCQGILNIADCDLEEGTIHDRAADVWHKFVDKP